MRRTGHAGTSSPLSHTTCAPRLHRCACWPTRSRTSLSTRIPVGRYLEQMSVHLRSLSALIDDLFELSRLEAGDIQWSMQHVRLDELVAETVDAMQTCRRRKAGGRPGRGERRAPPARANPEKLQRVLFNLIQNAIRHTLPTAA